MLLQRAANFCGAYTTLMTPFKENGDIDEGVLRKLVEFQIANGAERLCPNGVTGETAALTDDEKIKIVEIVVESADGRALIVPDMGTECLKRTIELAKAAEKIGVDAVLAFTPYLDPPTKEGHYQYFVTLADQLSVPLLMHNLPSRTTIDLPPETTTKLADHPNIVGIKEGNQDVVRMRHMISLVKDKDFVVLCGNDSLALVSMLLGGHGHISVSANVIPKQCIEITKAALAGDFLRAREIYLQYADFFKGIYIATNPIALKEAFNMLHFNVGGPRLPLTRLNSEQIKELKSTLVKVGLLETALVVS